MKLSPKCKMPLRQLDSNTKNVVPFTFGVEAADALKLMVTRYSAYAAGDTNYIIRTTHPNNPDFKEDRKVWAKELSVFCDSTEFLGLEVADFIDGENEAFVEFKARLSDGILHRKSRFLKENGRW